MGENQLQQAHVNGHQTTQQLMKSAAADINTSDSSTSSDAASGHTGTATTTTSSQAQTQYTAEYLAQLLKDKKQLAAFPNVFIHLERLIDEEINKVRVSLFQFEFNKDSLDLPEGDGQVVTVQEKVYVPAKDYPDYNFVGRILGPRGMTAKQLEQETGCKIMVRGRGSMRDKKKEELNRGKPNWEHLNDELHVLIQCEDADNRARIKIQRAIDEVKKLLVPAPEGEDELKRKQLMELAIINGTYRPANQGKIAIQTPRLFTPMTMAAAANGSPLRSPLGAPLILSPTRPGPAGAVPGVNHINAAMTGCGGVVTSSPSAAFPASGTDPLSAAAAGQLFFNSIIDPTTAALASSYAYNPLTQPLFATATQQAQAAAAAGMAQGATPTGADYQQQDLAGAILNQRRLLSQLREHPYQRAAAAAALHLNTSSS